MKKIKSLIILESMITTSVTGSLTLRALGGGLWERSELNVIEETYFKCFLISQGNFLLEQVFCSHRTAPVSYYLTIDANNCSVYGRKAVLE